MGDVAVSFAAVIAMGATPLQMALLAAVRLAPKLLFSPIAGVWVDRARRRPLMIAGVGLWLGPVRDRLSLGLRPTAKRSIRSPSAASEASWRAPCRRHA